MNETIINTVRQAILCPVHTHEHAHSNQPKYSQRKMEKYLEMKICPRTSQFNHILFKPLPIVNLTTSSSPQWFNHKINEFWCCLLYYHWLTPACYSFIVCVQCLCGWVGGLVYDYIFLIKCLRLFHLSSAICSGFYI